MRTGLLLFDILLLSTFNKNLCSKVEDKSPFVSNGSPADIADFPHQVAILENLQFIGAGTIVTTRHVLTAASE